MKALTGKRILVGRAAEQAGALSTLLRDAGATVVEVPFIEINTFQVEIVPQHFDPCWIFTGYEPVNIQAATFAGNTNAITLARSKRTLEVR